MSKAPASDWPDVSPAGLRKMAEIAAPNNGAVFRAAADEIERLSAAQEVPADILKYAKSMQKQGYSGPLMWASKIIDWVVEQGAATKPQGGA